MRRSDFVWPTPEKGTTDRPKTYVIRFLPDKKGNFYQKYYYHMFQSGEKWVFILCPKTHNFENYCPFCSVTNKLYTGSAADKKMAYQYKRKEKFVSNIFVVEDPRDQERDDDQKLEGSVRLYEFPGKVEMKVKEEIIDTKHGLGPSIFDPDKDGYDFILKVFSTKRDRNGNVWPDYGQSAFARRPSPIKESEKEIDEIMEKTIDIWDYIKGLEKTDDDMIQILKAEMMWDLIKDEWKRYKGSISVEADNDTSEPETGTDSDDSEPVETETENSSESDDDFDDEELLKELENM